VRLDKMLMLGEGSGNYIPTMDLTLFSTPYQSTMMYLSFLEIRLLSGNKAWSLWNFHWREW
jgi:hypothetical protein